MPIVECGFGPFGPLAAAQLAAIGPTIRVDIGFNPTLLGQATSIVAAGATPAADSTSTSVAPISASVPVPLALSSLIENVPALIDTGAMISCIDETLAKQLQLPLINQISSGGVHGQGPLNVYLAYISIPLLGTIQAGAFIGAVMNFQGQIHRAILGRSLLRETLLVYDGRSGSVKIAI